MVWSNRFLHQNGKDYFTPVEYSLRPVQQQAVWKGVIEEGSMWAFADQGSYKMSLRYATKNLDKLKEKAQELKGLVLENFSDEKLFEIFCDHFYNKQQHTEIEQEIDDLLKDLI